MFAGTGSAERYLEEREIRDVLADGLGKAELDGKRVLVIIPDSTRTAPVPLFFRKINELLASRVTALDFLVALGTHQPMSDDALNRLVGITGEERATAYRNVRLFNHAWDDPAALTTLGKISAEDIGDLSGGLMTEEVSVRINRLVCDYDVLLVCGPVFPHEVVGFSGGNKYFFPGISGPEVINFTHWLGAVITSYEVIGTKWTPVQAVIHKAASLIPTRRLCIAMVVAPAKDGHTYSPYGPALHGVYVGTPEEAYDAAADLSSQVHVIWVEKPYRRVLSVMPHMYDDIWTAAKGMYKLEPAIEDGGEVVIYAPHITEISYTHGKLLDEIGYHCRDYFLKQWDKFKHIPGGVLAHSTHLRGMGEYDAQTGEERLRIGVTLATGIPRERCEALNLGYIDPATINPADWAGREDEGILLVPKSGEMLYRVRRKQT